MPLTLLDAPAAASPEWTDRLRRRTFVAQDNLRILAGADRAAETGGIGGILRHEGLYFSNLTTGAANVIRRHWRPEPGQTRIEGHRTPTRWPQS